MKIHYIEMGDISPELLLCHRLGDEPYKRIYHPEITCISYQVILIQDKPDISIVNSKEYFAYPEDIIFLKPGDTYSSYSYRTNYVIAFNIYPTNVIESETICEYFNSFKSHYIINNNEKDSYIEIIRGIFEGFESVSPAETLKVKSLIVYLLNMLSREENIEHNGMKKSIEYIENNLCSKVLIEQLANEMSISRVHFHRLFKEAYGITPIEYVNKKKMKLARGLLIQKDARISEIANMLGFESVTYFRDLFKNTYGFSPTKYIKNFIDI